MAKMAVMRKLMLVLNVWYIDYIWYTDHTSMKPTFFIAHVKFTTIEFHI